MSTRTYEPTCGTSIEDAAKTMVAMAKADINGIVVATFNEIELRAEQGTTADAIVLGYHLESKRRGDAYLASPEYAAKLAEAEKAGRAQRAEVLAILADAPASMALRDAEGWAKTVAVNVDGYGACAVRYAERWARMMEAKIAAGQTLKECAEPMSLLADTEGITGYMHGAAVSILSQVWVHGDGLRAAVGRC